MVSRWPVLAKVKVISIPSVLFVVHYLKNLVYRIQPFNLVKLLSNELDFRMEARVDTGGCTNVQRNRLGGC